MVPDLVKQGSYSATHIFSLNTRRWHHRRIQPAVNDSPWRMLNIPSQISTSITHNPLYCLPRPGLDRLIRHQIMELRTYAHTGLLEASWLWAHAQAVSNTRTHRERKTQNAQIGSKQIGAEEPRSTYRYWSWKVFQRSVGPHVLFIDVNEDTPESRTLL